MVALDWDSRRQKWVKDCPSCKKEFTVEGNNWDEALTAIKEFFYEKSTSRAADKLSTYCKTCSANGANKRTGNGICREDLLIKQENKCAICCNTISFKDYTAKVDHNHETKRIRGILCNSCNSNLGYLENNPGWTEKALKYLKDHHHEDN